MKNEMLFPWPDPNLSPNKRRDRRSITAERQQAREVGYWLAHDAHLAFPPDATLQLRIVICPPDKRGRDDDNIYSSFKSYRDGIFKFLGMNDKAIRRTILQWGDVRPGGALVVWLGVLEK